MVNSSIMSKHDGRFYMILLVKVGGFDHKPEELTHELTHFAGKNWEDKRVRSTE